MVRDSVMWSEQLLEEVIQTRLYEIEALGDGGYLTFSQPKIPHLPGASMAKIALAAVLDHGN